MVQPYDVAREREPFPSDERRVTDADAGAVLDEHLALTDAQWVHALALALNRGMVKETCIPKQRVTWDAIGRVRVHAPTAAELVYDILLEAMHTQHDASAVDALLRDAAKFGKE